MTITPEQLRNIVKQVSAKVLSTAQAIAFLDIFQADLDLAMNRALHNTLGHLAHNRRTNTWVRYAHAK